MSWIAVETRNSADLETERRQARTPKRTCVSQTANEEWVSEEARARVWVSEETRTQEQWATVSVSECWQARQASKKGVVLETWQTERYVEQQAG